MLEAQLGGVQEHPLQSLLHQPLVEFEIAVFVVPRDRKPEMRGMHANLMGAPGLQFRLQQGEPGKTLQATEDGVCGLPLVAHRDALFAVVGDPVVQGQHNMLYRVRPAPGHQRQIALFDFSFAHRRVQPDQGAAFQRDQQHPRGFAVEPVHQFHVAAFRQFQPHLLDHPARNAAAAVHRHAGRLVQRDQGIVAVQDVRHQPDAALRQMGGGGDDRYRDAHRRNPHLVAQLQTIADLDAAAVDSHLAAAHQLVDAAFRHALQPRHQKIVQTLAVGAVVDLQPPDRIFL